MKVTVDIQKPGDSTPSVDYDVIVLGAGPYGLSATTHLRAKGLKVAVFGKPIHFWDTNMPKGMLLRSYWWATNLSDPKKEYDFPQYFAEKNIEPMNPLPIEVFIDYALWFQKKAVPDVDETYITNIKREDDLYVVTLEDGRVLRSKAVVMAPGLYYYNYIPEEYSHIPSPLVAHSSEYETFDRLAGKEVAVIGKGQGSLETAALINEAGANVHVVARGRLHWVPTANSRIPRWLRQLRAPSARMGSGWLNLLLEKYPYALQRFSRNVVDYVMDTKHGPAGSPWLKPRLFGKVTFHENSHVVKVEEVNGRVRLTFADGNSLEVDHVVLGTGYRPDVKRLTMLDETLIKGITTYRGSPALNTWFESSIPGLFFVGFSAARSFGPYYRFVTGVEAASRRVTAAISRQVARARR